MSEDNRGEFFSRFIQSQAREMQDYERRWLRENLYAHTQEQIDRAGSMWIDWFIDQKPALPMHDYTDRRNRQYFTSLTEVMQTLLYDILTHNPSSDEYRFVMSYLNFRHLTMDYEADGQPIGMRPYTFQNIGIRAKQMSDEYILLIHLGSFHTDNATICLDNAMNGIARLPNMRGYRPRSRAERDLREYHFRERFGMAVRRPS